jgi:hypothetical protein
MGLLLGDTEDAMKSGDVYTKQQRIAELGRLLADVSFTSLAYYMDLDWLHEAYERTRKDAAAGVDEVTAEEYERDLIGNLSRPGGTRSIQIGPLLCPAGEAGVYSQGWREGGKKTDRYTDAGG